MNFIFKISGIISFLLFLNSCDLGLMGGEGYKLGFKSKDTAESVNPGDVFYDGIGGVSLNPISDRISKINIRSEASIKIAGYGSASLNDLGALSRQAIIGDLMYFTGESNGDYYLYQINNEGNVKSLTTLTKRGAEELAVVQNKLYFESQSAENGIELFSYDPATELVTLVRDIQPGTGSSSPTEITVVNNELYFSATSTQFGREAYRYIPATNTLIGLGIRAGTLSAFPRDFKANGNIVYFTAITSGQSRDIYGYNTVLNQIGLVVDISPVPNSASNPKIAVANNRLLYSTSFLLNELNPATGVRRTISNTGSLSEANPSNSVVLNGELYYAGSAGAGGANNVELYKYNPVNDTTMLLADLELGDAGSFPNELTVYNGEVYFTAETALTGRELYKYNPNDGILSLVSDIEAGTESSNIKNLVSFGGKIYFSLGIEGSSLHSYDSLNGVSEFQVAGFNVGYSPTNQMIELNNELYFAMSTPKTGLELYKYEVDIGKVSLAYDITPGRTGTSLSQLTSYKQKIYFSAITPEAGQELYSYDPVSSELKLIIDLNPGIANSRPENLIVYKEKLYFTGRNTLRGQALYSYNSETETVGLVVDMNPSTSVFATSFSADFTIFNDELYFGANDGTLGSELHKYNSDTNQVSLVADLNVGIGSSSPTNLKAFNNELYFVATLATVGREVFRYNPVANQTSLAIDVFTGINSSNSTNFLVLEDQLYFSARSDLTRGNLLRKLDPLTGLQTPLIGNEPISIQRDLTSFNNKLYYSQDGITPDQKVIYEYDQTKNESVALGTLNERFGFSTSVSKDGIIYKSYNTGGFYRIE